MIRRDAGPDSSCAMANTVPSAVRASDGLVGNQAADAARGIADHEGRFAWQEC